MNRAIASSNQTLPTFIYEPVSEGDGSTSTCVAVRLDTKNDLSCSVGFA